MLLFRIMHGRKGRWGRSLKTQARIPSRQQDEASSHCSIDEEHVCALLAVAATQKKKKKEQKQT